MYFMVRIRLTEKSFRKEFIERLSVALEPHGMLLFDDPSISYADNENNKHKTRFPDVVIVHKDKISRDGEYHAEGASLGGYGNFYLELGPYAKSGNTMPLDSIQRTKKIKLRDILNFRRLEINTHIPK